MSFIIQPQSTTGVVSAPYTAGGVVYANGTGPLVTAAGTAGQVLQSNGAAAPSWVTPSAGAMTLISTQTPSGASSVSWTGVGSYSRFMLLANKCTPNSNQSIVIQLGTGSTPTYTSTGYENADEVLGASDVTFGFCMARFNPYTTSGQYIIQVHSSNFVEYTGTSLETNMGSFQAPKTWGGAINMAAAVTAIRVTYGGGATITGTLSLYALS